MMVIPDQRRGRTHVVGVGTMRNEADRSRQQHCGE
jgi:hypothetical protein